MAQNKQLFREDFPTFIEMPTRWMDNDAYGHMNNIVHYALIDTAVTDWQRNHGFFNEDHKCLELEGFYAVLLEHILQLPYRQILQKTCQQGAGLSRWLL